MALTQISTGGIKDDAVTDAKLPANSVGNSEMKDDAVDSAEIADGAVDLVHLSASGTASSSTFLRGDNSWQTVSSVGGATGVDFNDDVKARFGTGNDLEIYHDATDSLVKNATGDLILQSTGDDVFIKAQDDVFIKVKGGAETAIECHSDGQVELYYDHVKKLETDAAGVNITGQLDITSNISILDAKKITFGNSDDLQIYHDASHSYIANTTGNLYITEDGYIELSSANGGEKYATFTKDGAVDLYYDDKQQFETTNSGITVINSNTDVTGAQVLLKNYNNTVGYLYGSGTSTPDFGLLDSQGHWGVKVIKDGAVELYYDNSKKFETTNIGCDIPLASSGDGLRLYSTGNVWGKISADVNRNNTSGGMLSLQGLWNGAQVNIIELQTGDDTTNKDDGRLAFYTRESGSAIRNNFKIEPDGSIEIPNDSQKLKFGAGNDLQIYHDGSNSYIDEGGTGSLILRASPSIEFRKAGGTEKMLYAEPDAQVELYYDNTKRFETVSDGIRWTGHCYANDNYKLRLGTGEDLQLYHDGTNSYIKNDTGWLNVPCAGGGMTIANTDFSENIAKFARNGACELYYNGGKTLETTSTGGNLIGTWSGAGKILQVKTATLSQDLNTTSTSWVNTGLSESITLASTSNKIYVVVSTTPYLGGSGGERWSLQVRISASDVNETIIMEDDYWAYRASDAWKSSTGHHQVLYSPSTTNEITVNVKTIRASGSDSLWLGSNTSNASCNTITVMEIAG